MIARVNLWLENLLGGQEIVSSWAWRLLALVMVFCAVVLAICLVATIALSIWSLIA